LVTGSASGLGRNIAEGVLACGDRLLARARDPRRLQDLGGFTKSLTQDVAPFGVKVCALEPGGMRTNWEPSVGAVIKAPEPLWGRENSDPSKVARVVLRLAASDRMPAHILPGSNAVRYVSGLDLRGHSAYRTFTSSRASQY